MSRGLLGVVLTLAVSAGCRSVSPWSAATTNPHPRPIVSLFNRSPDHVTKWNNWADENLQDGDILFVRGEGYILMGTVNFSELSRDITDSRFSHVGLIAMEEGQAVVYDIRTSGVHRTRVGEMFADRHFHEAAIKRASHVSPEIRSEAVAYCRTALRDGCKFDDDFRFDNDRLYCSELVELAYRESGLSLSEPIRLRDLPNYERHARQIQLARAVTAVEPDQLIYLPGNERIGIWSNPELDLILDLHNTKAPPTEVVGEGHEVRG